jgi:DNA-binding response OmpR family regulator
MPLGPIPSPTGNIPKGTGLVARCNSRSQSVGAALDDLSEDALQLLDDESRRYRALVTDINLGHGTLSGWDVARRGREVNPELPVVYMTGDSAAEWAAQGVPNSVLLTKPFAPAQLLTAVSQLLNASGPIVS